MVRKVVPVAFVSALLYFGCAEEETDPPKRATDAGSDTATSGSDSGSATPDSGSSTPDAATGTDTGTTADVGTPDPCTAYCACMTEACPAKAANCAANCAARPGTWDLACRTSHCGYAKTTPDPHCGHAAGESTCP